MYWLFLTVLCWGWLHSLLASKKVKELGSQWFGKRIMRFYRFGYNLFACVSFLPMLWIMIILPDKLLYLIPFPWSGIMVFGELLALVIILIGILQMDVWEFLGVKQISQDTEKGQGSFATKGLYRHVRHPLYTAGLVFIWLFPLMTLNILVMNFSLTVYILVGATFEERKILREFGNSYANYKAATPMFIPLLKGNKSRRVAS